MIKLVIFDWDGTLADSVSNIIQCKCYLAKEYGLPAPSDETIRHVLGTKFEQAMATCFPTATKKTLIHLSNDFHILMQKPEYQAALFPHAKRVLLSLKKRGIKLAIAIATSKHKNELNTAITYHNLTGIFDVICCGDEYQSKPHPAMLKHIIKKCGITADETIMIGDTTTDILFAKNAGIKAIAVTFGAHTLETLKLASPDIIIDDLNQLPDLIE